MNPILAGIAALTAFTLGAIPFAVLVTRLVRGIDVRDLGTRNSGAANTFREVSRPAGIAVGLLDIAKGAAAVAVAGALTGWDSPMVVVCGVLAIAGHSYSPFLKFHGGMGLAPGVGAVFVLTPLPGAAIIPPAAALIFITRNTAWVAGAGLLVNIGLTAWLDVGPTALAGAIIIPASVILRTLSSKWWDARTAA